MEVFQFVSLLFQSSFELGNFLLDELSDVSNFIVESDRESDHISLVEAYFLSTLSQVFIFVVLDFSLSNLVEVVHPKHLFPSKKASEVLLEPDDQSLV